jgi:carboxymethylenebutenolidase
MARSICLCCALVSLLATAPLFAVTTPVTLHTVASVPFTTYVAGPREADEGIVLVHDWFGVSPFFIEAAEKLADQGYRVVAVDLYSGRRATTHEEAVALLKALDNELAGQKIDAAIKWLSDRPRRVAAMGFSMGAKHALAAARRNNSVRATVLWYGGAEQDPQQLQGLAGPSLLIVGSADGPSAADDALGFAKAADAVGAGAEVYLYPGAAHAFAQPLFNQGRTYDRVAADVAWRVSEDFLKRRLE